MSEVLEIVKALVSPIEKLIDVVASACGKVYEPTNIRRTAKAKAEELRLIGNEITDGIYLPTKYENGQFVIDTTQQSDLLLRAQQRFLFQESEKQQNIESVIANAYEELAQETEVSQEAIDKDWILRFFNSVEDISNEDMQKLWGKVLAGEIKQPRSFSFRALETLKNLTVKEAELFEKVASCAIKSTNKAILITELKDKYFSFENLLTLAECGLLYSTSALSYTMQFDNKADLLQLNDNLIIYLHSKDDKSNIELKLSTYGFSNIACQLLEILNITMLDETVIEYAKAIKKHNSQVDVSVHKITSLTGAPLEYDRENLLDVHI